MRLTVFILSSFLLLANTGFVSCQSSGKGQPYHIEVDEFEKLLLEKADGQLLDVRTPAEYVGGHLANAKNIDWNNSNFENQIDGLKKDAPLFVYCLSGGRSSSAAKKLSKLGFTEIYDLKGGILAWKNSNKPIELSEGAVKKEGMSLEGYNKHVKSDLPVLVNFYAPWCGPCKKMAPMLKELSTNNTDQFTFLKLNADDNDKLMKLLGVKEIPTLLIYKNGSITWQHVGLVEKETLIAELGLN